MGARTQPKAVSADRRARAGQRRATYCGVALTLTLALVLAGCGGGGAAVPAAELTPAASAVARTSGTPGATSGAGGAPTAPATATPAATITPITGARVAGAQDICSQPASVSAQPPASIPVYPGAQLHASQASGANAFFGFCTQAEVSAIAQFYTQQLPGKGWSSLSTNNIASIKQVLATRNQVQLTVTISPDALTAGETDIFVEEFAQPESGTPAGG